MNGRRMLLGVVLSTLLPRPALAWDCGLPTCAAWCATPRYAIGRASDDLEAASPGSTETELRRGLEDWSLVTCAGLDVAYEGRTGEDAVPGDGRSVLAFVDQGWPHGDAMIAVTTSVTSNRCIVESDILFNGENYDFVLRPGFESEVNAYSAALHEGGHFYGLGHSSVATATMYFRYGTGSLTLAYDDRQGICYLYPGSDPPDDCTVTGCPTGYACASGVCVRAPDPDCTSDTNCIRIQRCNLTTGRCENRPPSTSDLGAACVGDADCSAGICLVEGASGVCSETCDALDPRSCPSGFHCSSRVTGDCSIGLCLAGDSGTGAFGSACAADLDCASLFCGDGRCTVPCDRDIQGIACPGTDGCHPRSVGACGQCAPALPMGSECRESLQCASQLCYDPDLDGAGRCTALCATDAECDAAFVCVPAGDERLCAPRGGVSGGACNAAPRGRVTSDGVRVGALLVLAAACLARRSGRRPRPRRSRVLSE